MLWFQSNELWNQLLKWLQTGSLLVNFQNIGSELGSESIRTTEDMEGTTEIWGGISSKHNFGSTTDVLKY